MPSTRQTRRPEPRRRRLLFESLEPRRMLAYGDSYRDLENIDDYPPHVPFIELTETNNPAFQGTLTGLTPLTDAAILIRGDLRIFEPDYFLIAARKGDIFVLYTTLFQPQFQINGTYPFGGFANSERFFTKFTYTAPATSEYQFSIGGNGNVGSYELGLAIIPNKPVVADFSLSALSVNVGGSVSVSDESYDPEEEVLRDPINGGPNGIIQRQWSNGATSRTTSFTFFSPGIHTISLMVASNDGETASVSRTIEVVNSNPDPLTGKLSSVDFVSNVPILPDPGTVDASFDPTAPTEYAVAQSNVSEQRHPTIYAAGVTPVVSPTFTLTSGSAASYRVKGTGPDGFIFEGTATRSGNELTATSLAANKPFGPEIKKYDSFTIDWELSSNGVAAWTPAGQSTNTLYVSAATSQTQHPFETVVDLAVSNAIGGSAFNVSSIIDSIWSDFADRDVRRADGNPLHYYGDPATGNRLDLRNFGTIELLRDGTGQCGAWVNLLLDVLAVHGIVNTEHAWIMAIAETGEEMLIRKWNFSGEGSLPGTAYPYRLETPLDLIGTYVVGELPDIYSEPRPSSLILPGDILDEEGIAGQSTANPLSIFANHQVAVINGVLYDPSYGTKYASLREFEANVAAFGVRDELIVAEAYIGRDLDGDAPGTEGYLTEVFQGFPLLVRKEDPNIDEVWIADRRPYIPAPLPFALASEAPTSHDEMQKEAAFEPVASHTENSIWIYAAVTSMPRAPAGKGEKFMRVDASSGSEWFEGIRNKALENLDQMQSRGATVFGEYYANTSEVEGDDEGVLPRDSAFSTWDGELWGLVGVWDMLRGRQNVS